MGGSGVGPGLSAEGHVRIRPARPGEEARLREIAAASKAHWGYGLERCRAWAAAIRLSSEERLGLEVFVADDGGRAVAWAALLPGDPFVLDDLWVEPAAMARGIGTALFRHAADRAHQRGASRLEWEAEPNAVRFYERLGARVVGSTRGGWGRDLPTMAIDLRGNRDDASAPYT